MSVTLNKINTASYRTSSQTILYDSSKLHEDVNKLVEIENFFNSQSWQDMKTQNLDNAHRFANEFLTYHVGSDKFAITNNGVPIYDAAGIVANFNDNHQALHDYLDSNQVQGMHHIDGLIIMHIGSVAVISGLAAAATSPDYSITFRVPFVNV